MGYQNARVYAQQTIYDRPSLKNLKSAEESSKAAKLYADDARNLVVQAVAGAWLALIADTARVASTQAELDTAKVLFESASDRKKAGTVPAIDVLRAEVEVRTDEQLLLARRNQVEKDKLALARAIGLPPAQKFSIDGSLSFSVPREMATSGGTESLLVQAFEHRADYRATQASVRAAEFAVQSARSSHWPSVVVQADYGIVGSTLDHSHGTYSVVAGVRVPIYAGGKSDSDIEQAEIVLRSRRNAVDELRGRIEFELRNALLDLESAAGQVAVAEKSADLAERTLEQARDRFAAGVTDNIEVVQAQQLRAATVESRIAALAAHNAAKIAVASALGIAEEAVPRYLAGK